MKRREDLTRSPICMRQVHNPSLRLAYLRSMIHLRLLLLQWILITILTTNTLATQNRKVILHAVIILHLLDIILTRY